MNGIIIYNRCDYEKNSSYALWLKEELEKRNARAEIVFEDFYLDRDRNYSNIQFAVNRTRDYNISLRLELGGIKVYNNSKITLLGNNKLAAYNYCNHKGYKYMTTVINPFNNENIVAKPIYGHGGQGIYIHSDEKIAEDYLYQEYAQNVIGDIRFYILENEIDIAVLRKKTKGICSNYSMGNPFEVYNYHSSEKSYVTSFIDELNIDYCGVDFLLLENGELIFNEIEDVVGSRMLSELNINHSAEKLARIITKID